MDDIQKYIADNDHKLAVLVLERETERQKWMAVKKSLETRMEEYCSNDIHILKSLLKYHDPRYANTKIILPGGYPEEHMDVFQYAEECLSEDLQKMVLSFKDRYRCGVMDVNLCFCEERMGDKGRETVFTEIDDITPVNSDKIVFDKFTLPNFKLGNIDINNCKDIDWGDWDDTDVSASYEIEVMWIQPIFPK